MSSYATHPHALLGHHAAASRTPDWAKRLAFTIVLAALLFNFLLCFVNTQITAISSAHVIALDILITCAAALASFRAIGPTQLALMGMAFLYLLFLALIRSNQTVHGELDVKIIRDLMIPIGFFLLGTRITDVKQADTIVLVSAVVVAVVAAIEYLFLDLYLKYFNILMYYIARGTVKESYLQISSVNLFASGIRPEGRTLFPFLGDHRVSSVFLEPVSPGNFGVIIFFWAMARFKLERTFAVVVMLLAAFLIVMADNRFGACLCAASFGLVLLPVSYLRAAIAYLPVACVCGVLAVFLLSEHPVIDDSLVGRLTSSGRVLSAFDIPTWLGIGEAASTAFDCGYAYLISQLGIQGFVVFWFVLMALKGDSRSFVLYHALVGLYLAANLTISYSPFTIKTASLLWFLLGVLAVAQDPLRRRPNPSEA